MPNATGPSNLAIMVLCGYIAAQMLADVASLKIGLVAGWAVDLGTFIYPLTFTLRDLCHKLMGKRAAQTIILSAAGINIFMAAYLMLPPGCRAICRGPAAGRQGSTWGWHLPPS